MKRKVLFACVGDAGRSRIAAAFFNAAADPQLAEAITGGTEPADRVNPLAIDVMREVGIDLPSTAPRPLSARVAVDTHFLVTIGCGRVLPIIPMLRRQDWPVDGLTKSRDRARAIRDDLRERVTSLIQSLGVERRS
jgi:arsenate reductase